MDGVFMYKRLKAIVICATIAGIIWCGMLISDKQKLHQELIRLHVVANSDTKDDQCIKLQVRDAVRSSLSQALHDVSDVEQAKKWIGDHLLWIQDIANDALAQAGSEDRAEVTFCEEAFDKRIYDTFSLPAGIYNSLRIIIGEGEGQNWWCVAFPELCTPATADEFEAAAVNSGFSDELSNTLSQKDGYEIRFFFLDFLGQVENIFFSR